jgi:lipopolysaccharide export system permease protein
MRIHDRYLLRLFLRGLVLGLLVFAVIFIIVDVFEKIDDFLDHDAKLVNVAEFYLYQLPYILLMVLPVAGLLATIFTLGQLTRNSEVTALLSAGQSLLRISAPILVVALLLSLLSLYMSETWVPRANERHDYVERVKIKKQKEDNEMTRRNFHYLCEGGRIVLARKYEVGLETFFDVVVQEFDGNTLVRRIDAKQARWDGRNWVFWNGSIRTFSGDSEYMTPFRDLKIEEIEETPEDFASIEPDPEQMNFLQLLEFVRKVKSSGGEVDKLLVELHLKLSFPFSNFIIVMLGIGLTSGKRRPSLATGFGLTLGVSFAYYGMIRVGQALGHSGAVSPILAAWMGNLLFLAVGIVLLARANR